MEDQCGFQINSFTSFFFGSSVFRGVFFLYSNLLGILHSLCHTRGKNNF